MNYKQIDKLAPWVQGIWYDRHAGRWRAHLFPNTIIEAFSFKTIAESLSVHVMREIVQLVAEGLNVPYAEMSKKNQERRVADAKQVAAVVIVQKMPGMSYRAIGKAIGWANHSMVHHSLKNSAIPEIAEKIKRVQSMYEVLH